MYFFEYFRSPIGYAVFELLSNKHTDRQTSYYFIVRIYNIFSVDTLALYAINTKVYYMFFV